MACNLSFKGDRSTQLVGVGRSLRVAQLSSVEGETKGGLDTGSECLCVTEAEDTGVVDLGLDKRSIVEVSLGANFQVDVGVGTLGVVRSSCTSFRVGVDAVVVAGRVGAQVAQTVEGDGIVGSVEASTKVVSAQLTILDIVAGFSTGKEAITSEDSISSERGALEEVKVLTGVQTGLLVGGGEKSVLSLLVGHQGGHQLELESLGNVVLELNVVAEHVGSRPCLGESHAVLSVLPLGFQVTVDSLRLGVSDAENAEGDTVRCAGLDLERVAVNGVVLGEQVAGSLAKILPRRGNGLRDDGSFTVNRTTSATDSYSDWRMQIRTT